MEQSHNSNFPRKECLDEEKEKDVGIKAENSCSLGGKLYPGTLKRSRSTRIWAYKTIFFQKNLPIQYCRADRKKVGLPRNQSSGRQRKTKEYRGRIYYQMVNSSNGQMYRAVAGKKDRKRIHTFIHQWTSHRADVLEYRIKDSLKKID